MPAGTITKITIPSSVSTIMVIISERVALQSDDCSNFNSAE